MSDFILILLFNRFEASARHSARQFFGHFHSFFSDTSQRSSLCSSFTFACSSFVRAHSSEWYSLSSTFPKRETKAATRLKNHSADELTFLKTVYLFFPLKRHTKLTDILKLYKTTPRVPLYWTSKYCLTTDEDY